MAAGGCRKLCLTERRMKSSRRYRVVLAFGCGHHGVIVVLGASSLQL
jgi:hypothetical protein